VYYAHTDHLGTPRKLTDSGTQVVWTAEYEPFGLASVNEDPDGDGTSIEFNLRFPGQYYDKYSGLHYNYYRDYDPSLGRYVQSDPIGLAGGLNTYGYAYQNPLRYIDPKGEDAEAAMAIAPAAIATALLDSPVPGPADLVA
jgi:RHS repeat-associated protein